MAPDPKYCFVYKINEVSYDILFMTFTERVHFSFREFEWELHHDNIPFIYYFLYSIVSDVVGLRYWVDNEDRPTQ